MLTPNLRSMYIARKRGSTLFGVVVGSVESAMTEAFKPNDDQRLQQWQPARSAAMSEAG